MIRVTTGLLIAGLALVSGVQAQSTLIPFKDKVSGLWGYKAESGQVVVAPRYKGAGAFVRGRAMVEEGDHFAQIDTQGREVEQIVVASVKGSGKAVPPPMKKCFWSGGARFPDVPPSAGMECYFSQLRGTTEALGGELAEQEESGEGYSKYKVFKLKSGVVMFLHIGYEGSRKRLLLPGVTAEQAKSWQQMLYVNKPTDGCEEWWESGEIPGGAYIEQAEGC